MIDATLKHFSSPAVELVAEFMTALERLRSELSKEAWIDLSRKHPTVRVWRYFLSADPYTRWGFVKPRGYPGDAALMDFAYGHEAVHAHLDDAGATGSAIYQFTSGAAQSHSARERIRLIAERLEQGAISWPNFTAISVVAVSLKKLELIAPALRARIARFVPVDNDPVSLAAGSWNTAGIPIVPVRRNVLKAGLGDIEPAALVYSLGLFDYLADDHAQAVLSEMWSRVAPGGEMIVANLAENAANLGYCEAIMDWWMLPRSVVQMQVLGSKLEEMSGSVAKVAVRRHGCFYFLHVTRRQ